MAGESVCYHLFCEVRLFSKILPMRGTRLLLLSTTPEAAEADFRKACAPLGLEEGKEVGALSGMAGNELVEKLMAAGLRLALVVDGDIVPTALNIAAFQDGRVALPGV